MLRNASRRMVSAAPRYLPHSLHPPARPPARPPSRPNFLSLPPSFSLSFSLPCNAAQHRSCCPYVRTPVLAAAAGNKFAPPSLENAFHGVMHSLCPLSAGACPCSVRWDPPHPLGSKPQLNLNKPYTKTVTKPYNACLCAPRPLRRADDNL